MTILELAQSIIVIAGTSNGKRSFRLTNKKYVQFSDTFDEEQFAMAGNTAFQKAYQDERLKGFVNPEGVSTDNPLTVNSAQIEHAMQAEQVNSDDAVKIAFLIAQAQGTGNEGEPIDAFALERYQANKIAYTFTDGGQWPI